MATKTVAETVFERVRGLIVERLGIEEETVVSGASLINDLGADSLDFLELIVMMEDEFGTDSTPLEISYEDAEKIHTVQDAVDYLKGVEDEAA